jgi:hypothetical protein
MQHCQTAMPDEVQSAYEVWHLAARRNQSETARLCGIPRSTEQLWHERYRWREVAAEEDAAGSRDAVAAARAHAIAELHLCDQVRHDALLSRIGEDGKPTPGTPTMQAIKTMFGIYDRFGYSPQRSVSVDVSHTLTPSVTDAELDALLAAGDTAGLVALMLGKPAAQTTPPEPPPPPDFASDQLGGWAGPGPASPEPLDADFHIANPIDADDSYIDAIERSTVSGDGSG